MRDQNYEKYMKYLPKWFKGTREDIQNYFDKIKQERYSQSNYLQLFEDLNLSLEDLKSSVYPYFIGCRWDWVYVFDLLRIPYKDNLDARWECIKILRRFKVDKIDDYLSRERESYAVKEIYERLKEKGEILREIEEDLGFCTDSDDINQPQYLCLDTFEWLSLEETTIKKHVNSELLVCSNHQYVIDSIVKSLEFLRNLDIVRNNLRNLNGYFCLDKGIVLTEKEDIQNYKHKSNRLLVCGSIREEVRNFCSAISREINGAAEYGLNHVLTRFIDYKAGNQEDKDRFFDLDCIDENRFIYFDKEYMFCTKYKKRLELIKSLL